MATQDDVRRIALSLPGASEAAGRFAFGVESKGKQKGFVWVWMERVHPRKPRVPNPDVVAVRVRDQAEKAALIAGDPDLFFTEPHYDGFPAVLVRLPVATKAQLRPLIADAWRCQAPPELLEAATPAADSRSARPRSSPSARPGTASRSAPPPSRSRSRSRGSS